MSRYIIGIDGGGTKTLAVVWDENQNIIEEKITGFSNFAVNEQATKENLEKLLMYLSDKYERNTRVLIGVSGVSALKNLDEYERYLRDMYFKELELVSDGLLALYSIKGKGPKIMAIGGTGSIVLSINNNTIKSVGGHGHILGDEGSAYNLVVESFKHIINYYDKNDDFDEFSSKLLNEIKINSIKELKNLVYNSSKRDIASYAVKVNEIALTKNKTAIKLLEEEGRKLGQSISNIYFKNNFLNQVIIALRGSFASKSNFVKKGITKILDKNKLSYKFEENPAEPVFGAYNYYKDK